MLILIRLWHIIIHIKPVNISDKNTIPIYKIWMMTNIMPKLTGWTFIRVHQLHRTISQQISRKPREDLWKSLKEYLAEAEVKPGFDSRYSSQVFQSLEGSEDPGWTLTFLIEPHRHVVPPSLFNNQAEGKVMASKHSVGGVMLDTCLCAGEDAFVAA